MSAVDSLLAHLRPCPIDVEFEDRVYTIPAMDAVDWIALIDDGLPDLYEVFPALAGADAIEAVEDALWDGRVTTDDVGKVGLAAIGAAGDRPWWVVIRVIVAAKDAWSMVHVNHAAGMSLAGWLDEVWSKIMERIDPKKRTSWQAEIENPPKGHESEVNFDAEEQAFLNAMKAVMK